jgi:hypothetical protein
METLPLHDADRMFFVAFLARRVRSVMRERQIGNVANRSEKNFGNVAKSEPLSADAESDVNILFVIS